MRLDIDNFNLSAVERKLCVQALTEAGSIVEAANLLGITRHALKRRIIKHNIEWPRPGSRRGDRANPTVVTATASPKPMPTTLTVPRPIPTSISPVDYSA